MKVREEEEILRNLEQRKQIIPYGSDMYLVNQYLAQKMWKNAEKIISIYELAYPAEETV